MKKVIFFVLMMNFVGCQQNSIPDSGKPLGFEQFENGEEHPKTVFYPYQNDDNIIHLDLTKKDQNATNSRTQEYVVKLQNLIATDSLGVLEGQKHQMFGQIKDIAFDDAGRIYIADIQFLEVRVYDSNGKYLTNIGSHGMGPGEFYGPRDIELDESGNVYIKDGRKLLIKYQSFEQDYAYIENLELDNQSEYSRFLIDQGNFILRGAFQDESGNMFQVKKISNSSKEMQLTGKGYQSSSQTANNRLTEDGGVFFLGSSKIISYSDKLPYIVSINEDGIEEWVIELSNFAPKSIIVNDAIAGIMMHRIEKGEMRITQCLAIEDNILLLQVISGSGNGGPVNRDTWLIDVNLKEMTYVGDQVPHIYAIQNNKIYFMAETPHTRIDISHL